MPYGLAGPMGRLSRHRPRTVLLWCLPAFLASILWVAILPNEGSLGPFWRLALLTAMFVVSDRALLQIEIQRQTYAISLANIPLLWSLFLLPPAGLLLVRAATGAALFLGRERRHGKQVFNAGVVLLEVGVAEAVFRALPDGAVVDPRRWMVGIGAVAASDVASSLVIMLAIILTNGRLDRHRLASMIVPTLIAGVVSSTIGLIGLLVVGISPWAGLLLVSVALVVAYGFRAYGRFLRQHENLGRVYEFSRYVERARADPRVLGDALAQARDMLNASAATLWIAPTGPVEPLVVTAAAGGIPTTVAVGADDDPGPLRTAAMRSRKSRRILTRDVTDSRLRQELTARGVTEALVAPLRTGDRVLGTLELIDRQGQLASFGEDDLRLLDSLAAHLTAAIENQQLLDRLRHAAYHDRLTDLPNRGRLSQAIDEAIADVGRGSSLVVLCQLDIDRFKEVNDSLGHGWGDKLLIKLGERLRSSVPRDATVARVGADEFAVLTTASDATEAEAHATLLREAVSQPCSLADLTIDVAVSVGVALAPEHASDADTLMRRVDVALSHAKSTGRPVVLYDPTMDQESLRRLRLVTQLREAIDTGQVVVRYQPKIALRTRELIGVEALVRWNHPEYGLVVPDDFVPLAEVTGLIGPLTTYVLRTAVEQCRRWLDLDLRIGIAVNLSARSLLDTTFPDRVADLLRSCRVPTDLLTFELTESSVMSDPERMQPVLHRLHELGVGLSVDDFGTGYSSMAQLRRLPVDEVKIDKEFVLSMGTDLGDLAIVRAIIELGHSLGLRVVAEGVEDELARDLLVGNDCDVIQGYLVSRALDPDRLDAWLTARTSARPAQPGLRGRRLQLTS